MNALTMNFEKKPQVKRFAFEASKIETMPNLALYHKFINWVSGEFELYLQDFSKNFVVFFPSGSLCIQCVKSDANFIQFQIDVKCQNKLYGTRIFNQTIEVLNQVYKLELHH
ncbi:hypothetical protein [Tamlana sp. I1]|uniref:hypothetical protein n=1 Tax=Tamlana sp. I1 TaxID=2762061 RepID=UPI00188E8232|nr:hypothetical protein [Tamlana sp. I1]